MKKNKLERIIRNRIGRIDHDAYIKSRSGVLPSEKILSDSTIIGPGRLGEEQHLAVVADGKVVAVGWEWKTVARFKAETGAKEVRNCDTKSRDPSGLMDFQLLKGSL